MQVVLLLVIKVLLHQAVIVISLILPLLEVAAADKDFFSRMAVAAQVGHILVMVAVMVVLAVLYLTE